MNQLSAMFAVPQHSNAFTMLLSFCCSNILHNCSSDCGYEVNNFSSCDRVAVMAALSKVSPNLAKQTREKLGLSAGQVVNIFFLSLQIF